VSFSTAVRVYWEDTDAGGIVFYANYLKYFERARTEWLRSLGHQQQRLREEYGGMFVVLDAQLQYHSPARLDDLLRVTASVQEQRGVSLRLAQQAFLQPVDAREPERLLCSAQVRIGWVNAATMRPARIPAFLLENLA